MLPVTPFFGRNKEFKEIQQILSQPECRLLTILGPGGTGKTRLALQLAANFGDQFANGTAVVNLEPLKSADFFVTAIADVLDFSMAGSEPPEEQVGRYLADKHLLIILDNFEHILQAREPLLTLLPVAPQVKYLVTSRMALNLQEEWLFPLTGLAVPAANQRLEELNTFEAVQLFNERARRANPAFNPKTEAEAIIRICRSVDGMPLALELAAAWRKTLTCEEIADEIERSLDFLETRFHNVPERHRSIHTIFDHTWQNLSRKEQNVFKKLSVFRGGFEREAAVAVTNASLSTLSGLVDKSLLRMGADNHYHIHELLRQYAAEQLAENEAEVTATLSRHADYYINFLHGRRADITAGRQIGAINEIKEELGNIRNAWLWVVENVDVLAIQKAADTMGCFYQYSCRYLEGFRLFVQAVEVLEAQPSSRDNDFALLCTLLYRGWFSLRFGFIEMTEAGHLQSEEILERLDIPPREGATSDPFSFLAIIALVRGDYETAVAHAEAARQRSETNQDLLNLVFAIHILSDAYLGQGKLEMARQFAQQSYTINKKIKDDWYLAYILNTLGQIATLSGDNVSAKSYFQKSYEIRQAFEDVQGMALASANLGNIALKEQALAEAVERFGESHRIYQEINDKGGLAAADKGLGVVTMQQGDYETAREYFQEAVALCIEIKYHSFLPGLMVDIAEFFWQVGQRERPITILAFTTNHSAADHTTKLNAEQKLDTYRQNVSPSLFAKATNLDNVENLDDFCHNLLLELSLPIVSQAAKKVEPQPNTIKQPLIEPLTDREMDVLRLMADGRSNPEIAEELILSVGTVKGYTNKIFGKLAVRNRVEAVTRARELNLL